MKTNHRKAIPLVVALVCSPLGVAEEIVVSRVFVEVIQQVEIPARKPGVLETLTVGEGAQVAKDQEIARLDDRKAKLDLQQAKTQWESANHQASDLSELEVAEKNYEKQQQSLRQTQLENKASHAEAKNPYKILAAEKARDVAKNELDRGLQARADFEDAVSQSEIDGLRLSFERSELDAKQAKFEQQQQLLAAQASDESVALQELAIGQAKIEVQAAHSALTLARLQAKSKQTSVASAELDLEQHFIRSPIDGVVVELLREVGEWLQPGDPVMRIVRLNRLRVEGFVPLGMVSQQNVGSSVRIMIQITEEQSLELTGKLTFVSPQIDPVNQQIAVRADFDNPEFQVQPGMQGSMTIEIESK